MLGDMSCDFQTNSGVEVALMLQTEVTSARSSWGTGGFLMEQERHLAAKRWSRQQAHTRGNKGRLLQQDFYALTTWLLSILIRLKFRISDVLKKMNLVNM